MRKFVRLVGLMALFLLLFAGNLNAKVRNASEIRNVAVNFMTARKPNANYSVDIVATENMLYSGQSSTNYTIVKLKPKGWAIVSKDDRVKPVIGYSYKSNFNTTNMPIQYKEWMASIDKQIEFVKKQNVVDSTTLKEWNSLTKEPAIFKDELLYSNKNNLKTSGSKKGPLLVNIKWDQGFPWNSLTPTINGKHTLVGCVATAWAQIFDYYNWPTRGVGSHSYRWNGRTLSANFNTTYNWVNMSNYDKAKISRDIGIAVDMNYGLDSSGASTMGTYSNIKRFFKYSMDNHRTRSKYTTNVWSYLYKNSIDRNHPVLMRGSGYYHDRNNILKRGGHAWVCDGYDFTQNTKYFHFNWGWSGRNNGWFTLNMIGKYFNIDYKPKDGQQALFNIRPNKPVIFKKAHLTYPRANQQLTSTTLNVRWSKNSAYRVRLYVRSSSKVYLSKISYGSSQLVTGLPKDGSTIQVILFSYDRDGHYKGLERILVKAPKSAVFKKAHLTYPRANQQLTSTTLNVRWSKNSAYRVRLLVYSYGLHRYLFNSSSYGSGKTITGLPRDGSRVRITLISYDRYGHYKGLENVYVKAPKASTFRKSIITYPAAYSRVSNTQTIRWQMNSSKKVALLIYSYELKKYVFAKYYYRNYANLTGFSTVKGKLAIVLLSYANKTDEFKKYKAYYTRVIYAPVSSNSLKSSINHAKLIEIGENFNGLTSNEIIDKNDILKDLKIRKILDTVN